MKALLIGGTGTISFAITQLVAQQENWELYLLNRGMHMDGLSSNVRVLICDIEDEAAVRALIEPHQFDVVADFIAYKPAQVERDIRLFTGRTKQYMFISSASAYQKPMASPIINEGTPLANPYWDYSRDKIACEERLMREYRERAFPVTIVRPSHTYSERGVPVAIHGKKGSWQVLQRMLSGKPVIIHGDGMSLWTMTHASDFAQGFFGLMSNCHALGQAVQITSDELLNWNQVYAAIAQALGVELKAVHIASDFLAACNPELEGTLIGDKACSVLFDNARLKRLVPGFCAVKRFDEGVRETIAYLRAHPKLQVPDPAFDAWCDLVIGHYTRAMEATAKECRG